MKAFPSVKKVKLYAGKFGVIHEKEEIQEGMELRDYFAAKALQGIVDSSIDAGLETERIAEAAYNIADAMMKARKQ